MITVHHLNFSRSSRVLWLMEELGLEYRLERYVRDETFRAPASLKAIHPLGKAPVIQDGDLTIAESASVLTYINERYGDGKLAPAAGSDDAAIHDEWLQYVESSAAFPIMLTLIGGMTGGLPDKLAGFAGQGTAKTLDYIAAGIAAGPYLMGGVADACRHPDGLPAGNRRPRRLAGGSTGCRGVPGPAEGPAQLCEGFGDRRPDGSAQELSRHQLHGG